MWFWLFIFIIIFAVLLIDEFGRFPYFSFFDKEGTFWVRKYLFFKRPFDLRGVVRATLVSGVIADAAAWYVELWTANKSYKIRQAGIFCYKSNVELLNRITKFNPNIDMNDARLKKYLEAKNQKGFYVVDEHVGRYFLLAVAFLFTIYFLRRSIFG